MKRDIFYQFFFLLWTNKLTNAFLVFFCLFTRWQKGGAVRSISWMTGSWSSLSRWVFLLAPLPFFYCHSLLLLDRSLPCTSCQWAGRDKWLVRGLDKAERGKFGQHCVTLHFLDARTNVWHRRWWTHKALWQSVCAVFSFLLGQHSEYTTIYYWKILPTYSPEAMYSTLCKCHPDSRVPPSQSSLQGNEPKRRLPRS